MNNAKLSLLLLVLAVSSATALQAGDTASSRHTAVTVRTRTRWEESRGVHGWAAPFIYLGRAFETILHAPQILSEGMEGDRALVNRRGILGPKEEPVEDRIISPADDVVVVR